MPAYWTISYDGGAFEDADALGVSVATREMASMAASKLTLALEGAMDSITPNWIEGKLIAVKRDGTPFFTGTITEVPREGSGTEEGRVIIVQGPLWWLSETVYLQEVFHRPTGAAADEEVYSARVLLNARRDGSTLSTASEITAILQYAADAGAPLAPGVIDLPTITPVAQVATDLSLLEALSRQLAYHPDAVVYEDHSVSPPSVNVVKASSLAAVDQDVNGGVSSGRRTAAFSIRKLPARKPPCVAIFYERLHEVDDRTYREVVRDIHPPASDPRAPGAICVTIPLQGSRKTTQKQPVTTRTYPTTKAECETASGQDWWAAKEPALEAVKASLKFDDVKVSLTDANPPAPPAPLTAGAIPLRPSGLIPDDVPRELVAGSLANWMNVQSAGVTVTARMAAPLATINALAADARRRLLALLPERIIAVGGSVWCATTMSASFQATNALSKIYSRISGSTGAEAAPTGIAEQVYTSLANDAYAGRITIDEDEAGNTAYMGKRMTFSGQLAAYTTAIMPVQSVREDLQAGESTITFGPPGQLGPTDLVSILQGLRRREMVANFTEHDAEDRDTPDTVIGGVDLPLSNALASAATAPVLFAATKTMLDGSSAVSVAAGMVVRFGPSGVSSFPVAAKNFDDGDGSIYITIETDKYQKITSVSALTKASSLPASTAARRPNTTITGDSGVDGVLNLEIATISGGEIEQKTTGAIHVSEHAPRSLWNLVNASGSGARVYDDSAGTFPPSNGEFRMRRIVAGSGGGGVSLTVSENADDIEISAELENPAPTGLTGTFVIAVPVILVDSGGVPIGTDGFTYYSLTFTNGLLTACDPELA